MDVAVAVLRTGLEQQDPGVVELAQRAASVQPADPPPMMMKSCIAS